MEKDIELLAPAGNADALRAAVHSGANAVYIGGPMFNARKGAKNFSIDEIREFADYCHLYGVDLHVAVNTLIKERELSQLAEYARKLNDANVDALIVQDLGAASVIRDMCPSLPLHASTQMTVTSAEGVKYLEDAGFTRVVLARELSKTEVEYIVKHTKAEIEVFVHGALCMCYSGQCLMSSIIGGRSANRGRCAQPCRLPYKLCGSDGTETEGYILSPKDLALIDELSELKQIGVRSLKIEGRLKRAEYVSAVTGIYRKYLDNPMPVTDDDMKELKDAFSRSGFTKGYFSGDIGRSMMSGKNPGNTSKNVFSDAAKNRVVSDVRKIPVTISGTLNCGEQLTVTMTDSDYNSVTVFGAKAEKARNVPTSRERFEQQLKKLGTTPFKAEYVFCETDGISAVSVKEINDARRTACDKLAKKRTERKRRKTYCVTKKETEKKSVPKKIMLNARCETLEQALTCRSMGADIIYVKEDVKNKLGSTENVVLRTEDIFSPHSKKSNAYEVSSPAAARYYGDSKIYCGFRMNVYNSRTADLFKSAELVTLSPELNVGEIYDAVSRTSAKTEVIAYGRLPLMIMKNCPIKSAVETKKGVKYYLRDRKGFEFPLMAKENEPTVLLNSAPIFTADRLSEIIAAPIDAICLVFTDENAELVKRVFSAYRRALNGEKTDNIFGENEFTRGHFFRGVE